MDILSLFKLSLLIFSLLCALLLSFVVYKNSPRSATSIIFGLLCLVTSSWLVVMYISVIPSFFIMSLFLARLSIFLAVPQVILFFLLARTLPREKLQINKSALLTICIIGLGVMFIALSPFAFTNVEISGHTQRPILGIGIVPFALFVISFSLGAIYIFMKRLHNSSGIEKEQLRYVMVGILLMLGLVIVTILIPVAVFNNVSFVPLAPLYTLAFLGSTTYAIVRHRFLDIHLIVARSLAYSMLVFILATFYTVDIFVVSHYFFQGRFDQGQTIIYVILTLFVAFTFQPLKILLENATESIFFKGRYDSNEFVSALTKIMASTIYLDQLLRETLHELITAMHVSRGIFIIFKGQEETYPYVFEGFEQKPEYDLAAIKKFYALKCTLIIEEEENEEVRQLMRTLNVSVLLPLYDGEHDEGVLLLGEKRSGDTYSEQDIKVLKIFATEISVAIQNTKSFEEISKFNVTLRQEVDRATGSLQEANVQLKELDKQKDEFVSLASHELKTPMTAIKSYLWMALEGKGGELTEKQKFYISRSYSSVDRLIKLVNDMLNISRIDSGRLTIEVQAVDIVKLSQEVVEEVMPRAQELKIDLSVVNPDPNSLMPLVMADQDKIKEVLYNLIGNALKFTPPEGKITISFVLKDNMIEISVTDSGAGIDKENISKLFHKFGLLPGSYATSQTGIQGTGLGLYISRSIVEMHKGNIRASSEGAGKGAVFSFSLPVFREEDIKFYTQNSDNSPQDSIGLIHTQI